MSLFKQPAAIFLLAFVQLWNRFSHYGMRALLLLYMIKVLKIPDPVALGIFAVYCALVELGGIFGAYLARKILGLRRAVMLGGWLIGIGHLLLAMELDFFVALAFVILGSSLYTTNIATLLGDFYSTGDERREAGFTLFYMSINIGAFLATLLCGYVAERFGWHFGFGLAAIGMVIANVTLICLRSHLQGKGEPPKQPVQLKHILLATLLILGLGVGILALQTQAIATLLLPWITAALLGWIILKKKMQMRSLMISLLGLILFFAAEEQIGSSLLLLADHSGSAAFSAISLLAINPLVIMLGGTVAYKLLGQLKSPSLRMLLPFALAAVGFGMVALGTYLFETGKVPLLLIGGVIAAISFAELLIGPATYSKCSEAATAYDDPQIMALMPIGFSMAASLGGVYSQALAGAIQFDPIRYGRGFALLAAALLGIGAFLAWGHHREAEALKKRLAAK